ncbi:leucine-rich repeat-containing protein 37A2-like [Suricata suricatta]|uniref:leucine-rich repeat-containing protein 37A2-like n=1 Tax=Suricata suricatta TaxID=37032 RepID=UPI001155C407|nr:leucine-rich repeat-containing protein 37A2-like [Suricata suricatta]
MEQETPAQPPENPEEAEHSPAQHQAPAQPTEHPEVLKPATQQEPPAQLPDLFGEAEPSPTQEEASTQPAEPPNEVESSTQQEGPGEAQHPVLSNITVNPVDLEVFITPQPTKELEHSSVQQDVPEQVQAQHPKLTEVKVQPLDLGLSISAEPITEVETSTTEETRDQPSEPPKEVEVQLRLYQEVTFPPPGQDQAHHPWSPNVTVQPLDLELTVTPEPTMEVKTLMALKKTTAPPKDLEVTFAHLEQVQVQHPSLTKVTVKPLDLMLTITPESTPEAEHSTVMNRTTAPPPKDVEVTRAHPEQTQSQRPNLTEITVPPMDLEITVTAGSKVELEPSPTTQETPTQPPVPRKAVGVEYPFQQEVIVPAPSKDQRQHPASPTIPFGPVDLGLTQTAEPTEAEHSTTVKTTTPSPKDLEVTVAPPEQVQSRHANLSEDMAPLMDLEITVSQQPESLGTAFPPTQHSVLRFVNYTSPKAYTTLTEPPEQNATTYLKLCDRCTCKDEMLLCIGLSLQQRLRSVPVPEPDSYNRTFTILILSENYLTELYKDTFEGLLSLQYLDLSCNKIQSIERRTFEPLPFLQLINLGCNLLTELSFGTFQAWHGMQFLHKIPRLLAGQSKPQANNAQVRFIAGIPDNDASRILPTHMACCLCQFKTTIEVVCKTVKLHCDSECLTNAALCDEGESIRNAGSFMNVLTARKKSTSTEMTIEAEKVSSEKNGSNLSSPGDLLEIQLNQQLRALIPNNDVRRLISHVVRTLKMDCSETHVRLACAKLISRTGLLMTLLSEQQELMLSKAEWDTDQWKNENYINESKISCPAKPELERDWHRESAVTRPLKKECGWGWGQKCCLYLFLLAVGLRPGQTPSQRLWRRDREGQQSWREGASLQG